MDAKITIAAMLLRIDALTDDDKAQIKQMCKDAGIKTSFNKRCPNCFQDALLLLKLHYNVATPSEDVLTPSGNYIYHNGNKKVVWWYRHHYTELSAQSDDATIERYMAVHPLQNHFSRVEHKPEPEPTNETENGESGTESVEQNEGGVTEQSEGESGTEGQNIDNNEGVNGEGDNGGKEQGNETNE